MNALGHKGWMPAIAELAERFGPLTEFRFEAIGTNARIVSEALDRNDPSTFNKSAH